MHDEEGAGGAMYASSPEKPFAAASGSFTSSGKRCDVWRDQVFFL